jgi:ABC-type Fe3+ transport system permease subunit
LQYDDCYSKSLAYVNRADEAGQIGPLQRSLVYAVIGASVTVAGGFIAAWLLAQRRGTSSRALDFLLLAAIALGGYQVLAPAGWRRIGGAARHG